MNERQAVLGKMAPRTRTFRVVGGGISGLLLSYRLVEAGYRVELYERAARLGGLIETVRTPNGLVERAAHSILATPVVFDLFARLGIEFAEVSPDSKARFIWKGRRARRFPLSLFGFLRLIWGVFFHRSSFSAGKSLAEWGREFLGVEARDYLLDPFLRGIYAASPQDLSVEAAFPSLVVPEGKTLVGQRRELAKARLKGGQDRASARGKMVVPLEGMESVVRALEKHLRASDRFTLKLNTEVTPSHLSQWRTEREAVTTVLTVPAPAAAMLLVKETPKLATALESIRYAPLLTATAFAKVADGRAARGVGLLVPSVEQKKNDEALGILFNSSSFKGRVFDNSNTESYTLIFGGTQNPEVIHWSQEKVVSSVERELVSRLKIASPPLAVEWMAWSQAIPVYNAQLLELWSLAMSDLGERPGIMLFGNYTGEVSIRGMIEQSLEFVNSIESESA
jgi:oxygen-dependent protoporphyrinogen oxidase